MHDPAFRSQHLDWSSCPVVSSANTGVVSVLESVPLAVLVMTHLGEPMPEKSGTAVGAKHEQGDHQHSGLINRSNMV